MSNPYQSLINELRDSADGWDACGEQYAENSSMERRAADVIDLLTKQLADGPVIWMLEVNGAISCHTNPYEVKGSKTTPLYAIPIHEVKE